MKVKNITNANGRAVPNQFIIDGEAGHVYFQSYNSIIVDRYYTAGQKIVKLDRNKWDYSKTTSRYRNLFLGETKKETQAKIDTGEYILTDLN